MVNGAEEVYVERGGRIERTRVGLPVRAGAARRDRADPRAARPPRRRAQPDGRRAARRRLAGQRRRSRRSPSTGRRSRSAASRPLDRGPTSWSRTGRSPRRFASSLGARSPTRRSVLVSGGTGSGKTTLLNALSSFIPGAERVVTIEDAAELRLQQPHVVRLESRPASVEGRGEVTVRDLLRNALRMRPDRIVIGEVRGRGGARPAHRAQHRARRCAFDRAREQPRGRAAPARDAGADGRRRPPARGDPRAARARARPRRPHGPRPGRCPGRRRGRRGRPRRGRRWGSRALAPRPATRSRDVGGTDPAARPGGRHGRSRAAGDRARQPGDRRWLADAVEPLRRAGREGYEPTERERRRLALASAPLALLGAGALRRRPGSGAARGRRRRPGARGHRAVTRRRRRYRRAVERGVPEIATALADALAGGRSVRGALAAASASLEGPPAVELARVRADLELGASTGDSLAALARRLRSAAGRLLRRRARLPAARRRRPRLAAPPPRRGRAPSATGSSADARAATAQARFTGMLVVAMPAGAALFAELLEPGFIGRLVGDGAAPDPARRRGARSSSPASPRSGG